MLALTKCSFLEEELALVTIKLWEFQSSGNLCGNTYILFLLLTITFHFSHVAKVKFGKIPKSIKI